MNAMYDYQLLAQAFTLFTSIAFTIGFLQDTALFFGLLMINKSAILDACYKWVCGFSWAIFFWLMKAQF